MCWIKNLTKLAPNAAIMRFWEYESILVTESQSKKTNQLSF